MPPMPEPAASRLALCAVRLGRGYRVQPDGDDLLIVRADGYALRQRRPDSACRSLLQDLAAEGGRPEDLLARAAAALAGADPAAAAA